MIIIIIITAVGVAVIHNYLFPENVRRDGFKYAPVSIDQEGDRDLELVARGGGDFDSLDDSSKQSKQHSHKF